MSIDCGSQIVLCDSPIRFDTYKGCTHACKYCFVKRNADISQVEADNCVESLKAFIKGKRNGVTKWCDWDIPLHWGGMSDPFQPCEARFGISYECLKIFAETQYPFTVSTKGKLLATDKYLEVLKKCNAVVQISMVCSKYDVWEKGAPSWEERLEMCRRIAPNCKRLIVRLQPYVTNVFKDVIQNLPRLKEAGVYGVTVEGMKFFKGKKGFVSIAGDYCYPIETLRKHFEAIKKECHKNGLAFYCAENRLRTMGDSMVCCGFEGVEGFIPNCVNLEHLLNNKSDCVATEKMKEEGTASCFKSILQSAGYSRWIKDKSFADMMFSKQISNSYKKAILGEADGRKKADTDKPADV